MNAPVNGALPPAANIRILEFSGLGPTPFGAMLLADLGADVLRIERFGAARPLGGDEQYDFLYRSRPSVAIDLKSPAGLALVRDLAMQADVVIEGYRPGAMERLGLGPEILCDANPRLIYARMSGWGQTGPLAGRAGHDINYLAMTGALYPMGPADGPPLPPVNLVGNFGGGGTFLAMGVLAALLERQRSGKGQVLDVAMVDGVSVLLTQMAGWMQMGLWNRGRGGNLLDGSAYFYRCYETADGRHMAVGALEREFHDAFLAGLGLDPQHFGDYLNPAVWPDRAQQVTQIFLSSTQAEWRAIFDHLDACVSPVLTFHEAAGDPANRDRHVHAHEGPSLQPAPAPRFDRSPGRSPDAVVSRGDPADSLAGWSVSAEQVQQLQQTRVLQ
ncbi:CaiB/BaiF CoA-transferase family protein [Blastomonas sp. AAP53]|uniref:CaiB/BaiF CoA transferase family protein n=1 Tax=Blastomonas sp. AAP53 TaxID=1248760 RepID=UPI000316833C|nr:CaiB/BaiF CoA-transferase family protein [Blastomonas sp. AAP53]